MCEKTYCPYCGSKLATNTSRSVTLFTRTEMKTTWRDIAEQIEIGNALELFSVGDEISETLTTGEEVVFVVSGINVYKDNEVIFTLKDCLAEAAQMNDTYTNAGGWAASKLRSKLNGDIFNTLPLDLKAVISPRAIDGNADLLWLLSEREVFGDEDWAESDTDCGKPLPYYARKGNRVKGLGKDGSANGWWERSPFATNASAFCHVYSGGSANTSDANNSYGVCFGFCI